MANLLTAVWEYLVAEGGSIHRFTSSATPPTISLSQLIDDTVTLAVGSAAIVVWDTATSPILAFDYLYLQAQGADILIELTIFQSTAQVQVFTLKAASLPFALNDDTAYKTLGGTAGLITKIRAQAVPTNTVTATLRYGVGLA